MEKSGFQLSFQEVHMVIWSLYSCESQGHGKGLSGRAVNCSWTTAILFHSRKQAPVCPRAQHSSQYPWHWHQVPATIFYDAQTALFLIGKYYLFATMTVEIREMIWQIERSSCFQKNGQNYFLLWANSSLTFNMKIKHCLPEEHAQFTSSCLRNLPGSCEQ